ncbi:hypothetical protein HDV04_003070 [Boothiomyces sp. JEL0838]|nr:hypothetical protein HDV04_003070 [Boothiomyces sp. JEL0838]
MSSAVRPTTPGANPGIRIPTISKRLKVITYEELDELTPQEEEQTPNIIISSTESDAPTVYTASPDTDSPAMPSDLQSQLYSLPFFSEVSDTKGFIEEISKVLSTRKFSPGDVVISQGDLGRAMFFIIKGTLKVISEDGEIEFAELNSGTYCKVGEIAIVFDSRRTATVIAKTNCILMVLTAEKVSQLLEHYPDIRKSMKRSAHARVLSLEKEYEKSGKSLNLELLRQVKEFGMEMDIPTLSTPKRTHTMSNIMDMKISVEGTISEEDEGDDHDDEDNYQPPPQAGYLSIAGQLGKKLAEKRRASVAVWSDDKLMQFAQNLVNQPSAKESRFANTPTDDSDTQESHSRMNSVMSLNIQLTFAQKQAIFDFSATAIVNILRMLDLKSLVAMRSSCKFFYNIINEKDLLLFSKVNFSPFNKNINDTALTQFLGYAGQQIHTLNLKKCWAITDSGVSMIVQLAPRIVKLNLSSVWDMTSVGLHRLADVSQHLSFLDLSNCRKITDSGVLAVLEKAPNLVKINLGYCKNLTEKIMNHIAWSTMKEVNIQRCTGIHDSGFKSWMEKGISPTISIPLGSLIFALEDLNLSDCSFLTDETIQVLGTRCPQLKRLCLSFCCSLTENFALPLTAGCPYINVLDVSYCGGAVTDSSVLTLARGLPNLQALGLRGCVQLTDTGLEYLATYALGLNVINFTQCKNVSPNIVKKLGISWNITSLPVYTDPDLEDEDIYALMLTYCISPFSERNVVVINIAMEIAKYLKDYSDYLKEKAGVFRQLKSDWVKDKDEAVAKFRTMEDATELLRQIEILQKQIDAVVECNWEVHSDTDLVVRQGYRFILAEMISLFHLYNEAIVRVLGLYFEMEKADATKALECYKKFATQSKKMNDIFANAKKHKNYLMMDIPTFKSPPVSLVNTLEDYLYAPDFEQQRMQYKQKKNQRDPSPQRKPKVIQTEQPGNEKQLIDFFDTVQDEMANYNRAQSPAIPEFNSLWDMNDGFAKEADDVQKQIQATSNLLASSNAPVIPAVYNNVQYPPGYAQSIHQTGFMQNTFQPTNPFAAMTSPSMMPASLPFNQPMMTQMAGQQMTGMSGFPSTKPQSQEFTVESAFGNFANPPLPNQNKDVKLDPFIGLRQNNMQPQFTGTSQFTSNNPFLNSSTIATQNSNPFAAQASLQFPSNTFGNQNNFRPLGMQNTGGMPMQNTGFGMQNNPVNTQTNTFGTNMGLGLQSNTQNMGFGNLNSMSAMSNQNAGMGFQNTGMGPNQGSVMSSFHANNDETAQKYNYAAISLGNNFAGQPFSPQPSKSPMMSLGGNQPFAGQPPNAQNSGQKSNATQNNFNPFMS